MAISAPVTRVDISVSAGVSKENGSITATVQRSNNTISAPVGLGVGQKGDKGEAGATGTPGHTPTLTWSGDQIAVDGVVSGPRLTGPQGVQGVQGVQGIQGVQGLPGEDGPPAQQNVYIGTTAPDFGGEHGLFIQTGLPGGGITFWIDDGET